MKSGHRGILRGYGRWVLPIALFVIALSLRTLAKHTPAFIEVYYSRTIFPRIGRALALVNGIVSFSLGEILVVGLLAFLITALVYHILQVYQRQKRPLQVLKQAALSLLWALSLGVLSFLLLWGLNYDRQPLSQSLSLTKENPSDEQLERISRAIIDGINANYGASHEGGTQPNMPRAELYALIESAYQTSPLLKEVCRGGYANPKPIHFSGIVSWLGLSGVYMPFTGEANYNRLQPDFDLPYVIAHEKAHQCGIAREDEANFVAFLVCSASTNSFVRYSGYLNALRVVNELNVSAPERYRVVRETLGDGPRADLKARSAFWARFQGPASEVSNRINNSYLRANNVPGGTRSYSEDVALIISYYLQRAR
ncbi:MAG: hypothetical protein QOE77_3709 [Blastocatellia bacterium]|nr:hypothetical protein [Blastocatellia bacterium]